MTARAAIALVLAVLGFAVGWAAQGWRSGAELATVRQRHADTLRGISEESARVARLVRAAGQAANQAINAADTRAAERIAKNDQDNSRLRTCVAAGTCGVRIVTRYVHSDDGGGAQNPGASSVGDAAVTLDAATGLRVLDLRESVQRDAETIDYLQRYANACWRAGAQAE